MSIVNWLVNNIFTQTSIIMGLVAAVGLIAAKKDFGTVLQGFINVILGWSIFLIGNSAFNTNLTYFGNLLSKVFDLPVVTVANDWQVNQGYLYGPVILIGFLLHLLMERFIVPKKYRYVFLGGGHFFLRVSIMTTGVVSVIWGVENGLLVIIIGVVLSAVHYTVQPILASPFVKKLRGDDLMGYSHHSTSAVILTSVLASKLPESSRSTEEIKFPKALAFMKDVGASTAVFMTILFVVFGAIAGPDALREIAGLAEGGQDPFVWAVITSVSIGASMTVFLYGLRLFMTEILPAFSGFADKIVPGCRPSMDVPTVFSFGQNAVLVGGISCIMTFMVWLVIINSLGFGLLIPGIASLFMSGAGAGVFGNKNGGVKGAILGGIITGTLMGLGQLLAQGIGGDFYWANARIGINAEPDDYLLWGVYALMGKVLNFLGIVA